MRSAATVLVLLAVGGLLAFLALRSEPDPVDPAIDPGAVPAEGDARTPGAALAGRAPESPPTPDGGTPRAASNLPAPVDLRTVARGDLEVILVTDGDRRVSTDLVALRLERVGLPYPHTPLAHRDAARRVWTFRDVPVGRVRIHASGDLISDASGEAEIVDDGGEPLVLRVEPLGAIHVRASLVDGGEVLDVVGILEDEEGRPVEGWWRERSYSRMGIRQKGTTGRLGPNGLVGGLRAGRYRLDVESGGGGHESLWVDVVVGETAVVDVSFVR